MKGRYKKCMAVIIMMVGVGLMGYPWISNWLYDHSVDSTVSVYQEKIDGAGSERLPALWKEAQDYNSSLSHASVALTDPFVETQERAEDLAYAEVLDVDGKGLMCFVDIPKIDVYLPVFHGTSPDVLEKGVGHLEGSSLPVGGSGTHAVLSAHTGINSSKLFSDLTEMEEGDLFFIHVLDQTLAYRVNSISVIEPEDTSLLKIETGRDLVSLITCTPYGVNSHRLVVTGEHTEYSEDLREEAEKEEPSEDSQWMRAYKKAILLGMGIVGGLAVMAEGIRVVRSRKEGGGDGKNDA